MIVPRTSPVRALALVVASSVTVALGSGCPGPSGPVETQVIHMNNGAECETLDPHKATGVPEHRVLLGLLEGLARPDPKTLEPLPGAATSWEVSDDGLTYTFHMREGAKWSNGDPLTAHDFEYSWKRCLDPKTASQYAYMLYYVKGARAFNKGEADASAVGVKASEDGKTLTVTLENPAAFFISILFHYTYWPVHEGTIEANPDDWTRPEHYVGNGPYKLAERKPREHILFTPNEHYWGAAECRLKKIYIHPYDDLDSAYKKFLNGELDWLTDVPGNKVDEVKRHPDFGVSAYLGSYFYRLNTTRKPLDDIRVRKALSLAIDRREICQNVTKLGEIPAPGFVPQGIPGYEGVEVLKYDPEQAKKLLAEAGFPGGKGFPEMTLLYNTNESHKKVAEVVTRMWKETLGITIGLENTEWKVYLQRTDEKDYFIQRAGWIGDYVDPINFLDMWVTDGGNNNTGWSDEKYDRLVDEMARERDPQKRNEIMKEAERHLLENGLPIVQVYYYVNKYMLNEKVQGVHPNILDTHPWQSIWIADDDA